MKTTIEHKGKTLELTQEAYPTGGSFPVPGGATYNGNWYEASAKDGDDNNYRVIWTAVDWSADDASGACDWDNPDYVAEE